MYRRYYSYNDMPTVAKKSEAKPEPICPAPPPAHVHKKDSGLFENGKILGRFEADDVILLIVIVVLLFDDCDDKLLLAALGFVFLADLF